MVRKSVVTAFFAVCSSVLSPVLYAESQAIALPGDTKLVVFNYDQNSTYTVLGRPGALTDIALSEDEQLVALAMGDTARWVTNKAPGHVFSKPIFPDISTSATLVTSKRAYQLNLRSSPENGKFYQRVSWEYPELIALRAEEEARALRVAESAKAAEVAALESTVVSRGVEIENLNFDYVIDGNAPFKPLQVFDDGKFTWIRLPKVQELPVLFLKNKSETEMLNYHQKDSFLVVHRLAPEFLLKIGEKEVVIANRRMKSRNFWGFGE